MCVCVCVYIYDCYNFQSFHDETNATNESLLTHTHAL